MEKNYEKSNYKNSSGVRTDRGGYHRADPVRGVGLGILVSDRPQNSMASYRVKDSGKVLALLQELTGELKKNR